MNKPPLQVTISQIDNGYLLRWKEYQTRRLAQQSQVVEEEMIKYVPDDNGVRKEMEQILHNHSLT